MVSISNGVYHCFVFLIEWTVGGGGGGELQSGGVVLFEAYVLAYEEVCRHLLYNLFMAKMIAGTGMSNTFL